MKILKYLMMVATLLIVCVTFAMAADEVVATVNGQPYTSVSDAFQAASSGSKVRIVSNTTIDTQLSTPDGISIEIPRGVRVTLDGVRLNLINSNMSISGDVVRSGESTYSAIFVQGQSRLDLYGGLISANESRYGILCSTANSSNSVVNIYGGRIVGFQTSVSVTDQWLGHVNVYGGEFIPDLILSDKVTLSNGANFVSGYGTSVVSWGGLFEIGRIVSSGISWISLFCAAIIANKLLLIFIIFFMGFAGIGLIRRIIR